MNVRFAIAVAGLLVMPAFALAQSAPGAKPPKPTKASADAVLASITGDKAKLQAYCDLSKLGQQMAQADEKKDEKLLQDLGAKSDALAQKLGPAYAALMDGLDQVDENSADGKAIAAAFDALDAKCK